MNTPEFNAFLIGQEKRDRVTDKCLADLREDIAMIHSSRHQTQENLSIAIGELRLDCATTDKNLAVLSDLVKELVQGLKGNGYGSSGVVSQVAEMRSDLNKLTAKVDTVENQAKGMRLIISWGVAAVALAVAFKNLFFK
jgi:CDP-diacylglycerol pyrophosphatase